MKKKMSAMQFINENYHFHMEGDPYNIRAIDGEVFWTFNKQGADHKRSLKVPDDVIIHEMEYTAKTPEEVKEEEGPTKFQLELAMDELVIKTYRKYQELCKRYGWEMKYPTIESYWEAQKRIIVVATDPDTKGPNRWKN